jgi:hypothetical protein
MNDDRIVKILTSWERLAAHRRRHSDSLRRLVGSASGAGSGTLLLRRRSLPASNERKDEFDGREVTAARFRTRSLDPCAVKRTLASVLPGGADRV